MHPHEPITIHNAVRDRYAQIVRSRSASPAAAHACCSAEHGSAAGGGATDTRSCGLGYTAEQLAALPAGADLGLGSGNPVAEAAIEPGQTVLDLGSGAGIDCFLAAQQVGPAGHVIGVDMTDAMVERAAELAAEAGYDNISFRRGQIEHLPVESDSVDRVISNCVVNLSPEKPAVWRESFRVLKPGGRLVISDIVASAPLPESLREQLDLACGCIAGAAAIEQVRADLEAAGFAEVRIEPQEATRRTIERWLPGAGGEPSIVSAMIHAVKPQE